jgi:hypothetical protein
MAPYSEDWRTIAEQASREMDPKKLAVLVNQLCCAFNERDKRHGEKCGTASAVKSPLPANPALSGSSLPNPTA